MTATSPGTRGWSSERVREGSSRYAVTGAAESIALRETSADHLVFAMLLRLPAVSQPRRDTSTPSVPDIARDLHPSTRRVEPGTDACHGGPVTWVMQWRMVDQCWADALPTSPRW